MTRAIISNKQAFQSYVLTTTKYDFSPYEKRIVYRLIELAQKGTEGIKLKDNLRRIALTNLDREITMSVSGTLKDERDKRYTVTRATFRSLPGKHIKYEDDEMWSYTPIITASKTRKNSGSAELYAFDNTQRCSLDFIRGFKKYKPITVVKLKSAYAMRFYEPVSGQTKPLFVPSEGPDGLHKRFYLQGKHGKVNDLRRKVIDVAKKELDESSPHSFVVKEEKAGKKIISWAFFPVFYENREDPIPQEQARMAKVTVRLRLGNDVYSYLKFSPDLKSDEISKDRKTFIEGQNHTLDFMGFLGELKEDARLAGNPKGYVIDTIKRKLEEI